MPVVVIKKDEDKQRCCNVLCRLNGDKSAVGSLSVRCASPFCPISSSHHTLRFSCHQNHKLLTELAV